MREWRSCEICGGPADVHHIISRGAGGKDETWNLLCLCRMHHSHYHNAGWWKFVEWYPRLRAKVETAREMAGRPTLSRVTP